MSKIKGCAFLCDENGTVKQILKDDFDLAKHIPKGSLFTSFLDNQSMGQALNLLEEVKKNNVAFDYRLNVTSDNTLKSLYFLAVILNDQILFIGADNHKEAMEFSNHLRTMNNEQANQIRSLLKEKSKKELKRDKETENLLEQLTGLNNELINLQRKLEKQNKELEMLNEIKNRFIGIASHDLRNPLNVIQIYSEFLMENDGNNLTEEQLSYSKIINDSAQFMIALVSDLLEFSKIESGKIELTIQQFDIVNTAKGIVNLLKPIAKKKNIIINFNANINKLLVEADLFKIEQVFNNLLGNAIKFSYPETAIEIYILKQNNWVEIAFENTGDGIKPEDREKLFKPFQKIAAHGTGHESGSGLGLFIVKQIIDNHKGKIELKSEPGKKTNFIVSLPVNQ